MIFVKKFNRQILKIFGDHNQLFVFAFNNLAVMLVKFQLMEYWRFKKNKTKMIIRQILSNSSKVSNIIQIEISKMKQFSAFKETSKNDNLAKMLFKT